MFKGDFPHEAINAFLRMHTAAFTPKFLQRYLLQQGIRVPAREIPDYLDMHPLVFELSGNEYVSRAGLFTAAYFSIKPSAFELREGILVIGHRCMPFADPEMLPHELQFFSGKYAISKKCMEVFSDDVLDMYRLFGEEYVPQYLALDPGNEQRDFAGNDYEIPNRINMTVCDMQPYYERWDFSSDDRLLARVADWHKGLIEIVPLKQKRSHRFESTPDDERRRFWYRCMDSCLQTAIRTYGPCGSIEEQLAFAYLGNTGLLCRPDCGSIEEYLAQTESIDFAEYGVETRLWKKGEEVYASPLWKGHMQAEFDFSDTLFAEIGIPIPEFMLDAYIFDSLYRKDKTVKNVYKRIVPETCVLDEWQVKTFLLHLESRYAILSETYNRFTDFTKAEVRRSALELYSALVKLMCELDSCGLSVDAFPQQDLVILSQLFAHTGRLIEVIVYQENLTDSDIVSASVSLEGMVGSFEDIEEVLIAVMHSKKKDAFSIIK
ncbi:hypothetical protein H0R92_12515 [Treponema sp. OMZ 840]|uniref:hypothetical protein n=1 Tax=Treponema sp. OMZ 840 TaxID=244313 RepID=UPI003D947292